MNTSYRAGLVLLGLLSLGDVAAPLLTDGKTPPMFIALIGCALGLLSLALAGLAWRGRASAAIGLIVLRVLSALTAVPAFTVPGVPLVARILAGVAIIVTLIGSGLVLTGVGRRTPVAVA